MDSAELVLYAYNACAEFTADGWVMLSHLRARLGSMSHALLDAELRHLAAGGRAELVPLSESWMVDEMERNAAIGWQGVQCHRIRLTTNLIEEQP